MKRKIEDKDLENVTGGVMQVDRTTLNPPQGGEPKQPIKKDGGSSGGAGSLNEG